MRKARKALLLDNDPIESSILTTILNEEGFDVVQTSVESLPLDYRTFNIAVLDVSARVLDKFRLIDLCNAMSGMAILIMMHNGTIESTLGPIVSLNLAIDYVKKPFSKAEFLIAVGRSIQHAELVRGT